MGIAINMQRVFNPLVEAGTLRLQDSQIGNFNVAIDDLNVSVQDKSKMKRNLTIRKFMKNNQILFLFASLCLQYRRQTVDSQIMIHL